MPVSHQLLSGESPSRASASAKAEKRRFRLADLVNRTLLQTEAFKRPHWLSDHGFIA